MKQRRFGGAGGEGNRQPVYYQGSIEKHLGTNRTPPSVTPNHSAPVSPAHSAKPQGEVAQGGHGGRKQDGGCGGAEDGVPKYHPSMMLQMLYLSNGTQGVTCSHMAPFSFTVHEHTQEPKQALMYNN